jgi:chorismate synthase
MPVRFLTSGESHGKCLNVIIEGIPSNFVLDFEFINKELARRQCGFGRGGRMAIENDMAEFKSGVRFSKTLGSPICIEIKNKDWENWQDKMSAEVNNSEFEEIHLPRPGHADFAGALKYDFDDIRNVLERSSARETAARGAVGAVAQDILRQFGILGEAKVVSVGGESEPDKIKEKIETAQNEGNTLGGVFEIKFKNIPVGLGTYVHWDRRLDGLLAQAIMSIPAVKSVEIGLGAMCANILGSSVHDEIFFENNQYFRKTNNAGGIEGGMTNGEDIVITGAMKPIPTMKKPLKSVDIKTQEAAEAHFERSDVCAVEACSVVALNMAAFVVLNAFLERYGCDNYEQIRRNYEKQ